jgi:hypothetical protein
VEAGGGSNVSILVTVWVWAPPAQVANMMRRVESLKTSMSLS